MPLTSSNSFRRRVLGFFLKSIILQCAVVAVATAQQDARKRYVRPPVIVTGFPAEEGKTPVPMDSLGKQDIEPIQTIQEAPRLLSITPSAVFSSYSGTDIGYTFVSIRGFDQRRLSLMVNGIPQNDPEDHNVYWINMPDLASSTNSLRVQRGAGTSVFGSAAIGGSIDLTTELPAQPSLILTTGYGSFNTRKYSIEGSSGFVAEKYLLTARLSQIHTDGYRDHSWADLSSYYFSASRIDDNFSLQFNLYGGPFRDALNYYGVFGKSALKDPNLRKSNPIVGPDEIEEFSQPHYEWISTWQVGEAVSISNALFYVQGDGYFDYDGTYAPFLPGSVLATKADYYGWGPEYASRYGFTPIAAPDSAITPELLRGFVGKRQWGWLPRLEYRHTDGKLSIGGELRAFSSNHWGKVMRATQMPQDLPQDYHFYDYDTRKTTFSLFASDESELLEGLRLHAGLQFISHDQEFLNEKPRFIDSARAAEVGVQPGWMSNAFSVPSTFLNPRVGIGYSLDESTTIFGSVALTSREPRMNDYYSAEFGSSPNFSLNASNAFDFTSPRTKPERLLDLELGIEHSPSTISEDVKLGGSLNVYQMSFRDEIVKTGGSDPFGGSIVGNAERTEHRGVEVAVNADFSDWLRLRSNITFSSDKVLEFLNAPTGESVVGKRPIGFPSTTFSANLSLTPATGMLVDIRGHHVGEFFGDLQNTEAFRNDPYTVFDVVVGYTMQDLLGVSQIGAKVMVNNLFDVQYTTRVEQDAGFFVAAPRHYFVTVTIGL